MPRKWPPRCSPTDCTAIPRHHRHDCAAMTTENNHHPHNIGPIPGGGDCTIPIMTREISPYCRCHDKPNHDPVNTPVFTGSWLSMSRHSPSTAVTWAFQPARTLSLAAIGAQAEHLERVIFDGEPVFVGDALEPGFGRRLDFHRFAALPAHQMMVMAIVAAQAE